jgi:hypothetical protein
MLTFVTIIEDPTASSPDFWENVFHINLVLVVLPYFTVMPLTKFLDKLIMLPYTKSFALYFSLIFLEIKQE